MELKSTTTQEWVDAVVANFDHFLLDHAANERKASAAALTFLVRFPDKTKLIEPMIVLAREELAHFHRVYKLMEARGLVFERDTKDPYLAQLRRETATSQTDELLDRLLLAGVVEARGCERFFLVAGAVGDTELGRFYTDLAQSESRHADLFVTLAEHYFDRPVIHARLDELLDIEARVVAKLPIRAALH